MARKALGPSGGYAVEEAGVTVFVTHGSTAGTARPAGAGLVIWIGTVTPSNAAVNDLYINIS
jgi:hypothetical protein